MPAEAPGRFTEYSIIRTISTNRTGVVSFVKRSMPPRTPKTMTKALISRKTVWKMIGLQAEDMKLPKTAECSALPTDGSENENVSDFRKYSMDQPPTTL